MFLAQPRLPGARVAGDEPGLLEPETGGESTAGPSGEAGAESTRVDGDNDLGMRPEGPERRAARRPTSNCFGGTPPFRWDAKSLAGEVTFVSAPRKAIGRISLDAW